MAGNAPEKTGYQKTIVCLANSTKTGGRCIVGKEISERGIGNWVRPISARQRGEISLPERRYQDGRDPRLLDIIRIRFLEPRPKDHQIENHLINPQHSWAKVGTFPLTDVSSLLDEPEVLWGNGHSSYSGLNNRVPADPAAGCSTYLVALRNVALIVGVKAPEYPDSKRAVRARFHYRDVLYIMDVTDPEIRQFYLRLGDGEYVIESPFLCISLAEDYGDGYCYKLVAAIITLA